jgi:hypothetical protein
MNLDADTTSFDMSPLFPYLDDSAGGGRISTNESSLPLDRIADLRAELDVLRFEIGAVRRDVDALQKKLLPISSVSITTVLEPEENSYPSPATPDDSSACTIFSAVGKKFYCALCNSEVRRDQHVTQGSHLERVLDEQRQPKFFCRGECPGKLTGDNPIPSTSKVRPNLVLFGSGRTQPGGEFHWCTMCGGERPQGNIPTARAKRRKPDGFDIVVNGEGDLAMALEVAYGTVRCTAGVYYIALRDNVVHSQRPHRGEFRVAFSPLPERIMGVPKHFHSALCHFGVSHLPITVSGLIDGFVLMRQCELRNYNDIAGVLFALQGHKLRLFAGRNDGFLVAAPDASAATEVDCTDSDVFEYIALDTAAVSCVRAYPLSRDDPMRLPVISGEPFPFDELPERDAMYSDLPLSWPEPQSVRGAPTVVVLQVLLDVHGNQPAVMVNSIERLLRDATVGEMACVTIKGLRNANNATVDVLVKAMCDDSACDSVDASVWSAVLTLTCARLATSLVELVLDCIDRRAIAIDDNGWLRAVEEVVARCNSNASMCDVDISLQVMHSLLQFMRAKGCNALSLATGRAAGIAAAHARVDKLAVWLNDLPESAWSGAVTCALRSGHVDAIERGLGELRTRWCAAVRSHDFTASLGELSEDTVVYLLSSKAVDAKRALQLAIERGWGRVVGLAGESVELSDVELKSMLDKLKRSNKLAIEPFLRLPAMVRFAERNPESRAKCAVLCSFVCGDLVLYQRFDSNSMRTDRQLEAAAECGRPEILAHLLRTDAPFRNVESIMESVVRTGNKQCMEILLSDYRVRSDSRALRRAVMGVCSRAKFNVGSADLCGAMLRISRADFGLNDAAVMADWKRRLALLLADALADGVGSVADALRSSWSDEIASADFTSRSDRLHLRSSLEKLLSTNDIDSVEMFMEVAPRCATIVVAICNIFRRSIAVEFGVRLLRAALRKEWFVLDPRRGAELANDDDDDRAEEATALAEQHSLGVLTWLSDQEPFEAVAHLLWSVLEDSRFLHARALKELLSRERAKQSPNALIVTRLEAIVIRHS